MPEKAFDVRAALSALRRGRKALTVAALVGALAGLAFLVVRPPMYVATVQVYLSSAQGIDASAVERPVETEIAIISSAEVLGPARRAAAKDLSLEELADRVTVTATTDELVRIEVRARTLQEARALRTALAESTLAYLEQSSSRPVNVKLDRLAQRRAALTRGLASVNRQIRRTQARQERSESRADASALAQLTARQAGLLLEIEYIDNKAAEAASGTPGQVVRDTTAPRRSGVATYVVLAVLAGAAGAVLLVGLVVVLRSRRERVVRHRDDIADAVGSHVMASVRSQVGRDAAGWLAVLESYEPRSVDAWALRQVLHQAVLGESPSGVDASSAGADGEEPEVGEEPPSILVLCLSGDDRGLAVGPQLASYAASIGVHTRLIPGQLHESAASLWAACAKARARREVRPRLAVINDSREGLADLTLVLAVVDREQPVLAESLPRTEATVIAVGAGAATADELAMLAVAADEDDRKLFGVVVADPDSLDPTTGRMLKHERPSTELPSRLTGADTVPGGIVAVAPVPAPLRGVR